MFTIILLSIVINFIFRTAKLTKLIIYIYNIVTTLRFCTLLLTILNLTKM